MVSDWAQKGKQRAPSASIRTWPRDDSDSSGGGNGIVVPLQYVGTTAYNAAYTLPITLGSNNLNVSLQIDTGSSDLWVTDSSCSTSACNNVPSNKRYDASSSSTSIASGSSFNVSYLEGQALGLVVWDSVDIGGYTIDTQAFAAASTVNSEPLSSSFNGIIGLALPDNSIISRTIPSSSSSTTDGSQFTSNIFSLSPSSLSPAARFLSITLERPGSSTIPSLFGIGKHPSQSQVPQIGSGEDVQYATSLASLTSTGISAGYLFWKASIADITVWVDGQAKPITLQKSSYEASPSAILDTGVPVILSTKVIADAIYGAIGVSPASDGNYYVSCTTPLNLTVSLDSRLPISVHPLDLTTEPPSSQSSSSNCIGLIQAADQFLSSVGVDMILGVPFIRNTYMVMAYQVPDSNGSFPDLRGSNNPQSPSDTSTSNQLSPRLGLQGLTNATVAMGKQNSFQEENKKIDSQHRLDEFQKVRVLGQSINGTPTTNSDSSKKSLSVGLDVLFGLIGFFGLCFILFGIRFCFMRRRYRGSGASTDEHGLPSRAFGGASATNSTKSGGLFAWFHPKKISSPYVGDQKGLGAYELAGRTSPTTDTFPSEDALRQMRYQAYMNKERLTSEYTVSSEHTRIGDAEDGNDAEMGWRKKIGEKFPRDTSDGLTTSRTLTQDADWNPAKELDWNRDTLVGLDPPTHNKDEQIANARALSPEGRPIIPRRESSDAVGSRSSRFEPSTDLSGHGRGQSITLPLLQLPETALMLTPLTSQSTQDTADRSPAQTTSSPENDWDLGEFGSGMAGVGSARRNERLRSESLDISGDINLPSSVERPASSYSSYSSRFERGRPARTPTGPRHSTLSTSSSIIHD
ncbi:aspartic peptidase domain-containing protein [Lentinula lateritia]|uniref:Aspartic peptidase domain-containing protein n=1 Tax=Lentinula lateritia TaxID=40482 RepID=A0ABQ8V9A2_9AGAR|nr:aspartic peptidase domain-containing protein [Lentinula lateritia]